VAAGAWQLAAWHARGAAAVVTRDGASAMQAETAGATETAAAAEPGAAREATPASDSAGEGSSIPTAIPTADRAAIPVPAAASAAPIEATFAPPPPPPVAAPAREPPVPSPLHAGAPTQVTAVVRPYAQRALLDGVEIAHGEQRVVFALAPGRPHRIEIEHACCVPFVREFGASEAVPQPFELKVPLTPRPARLRIEAEPEARAFVEDRLLGTAEESQRAAFEIPVAATGATPYEAQVELRLERDGAIPVRTTLKLRAGTELTFAAPPPQPLPLIEPPPAAQRRTEVVSP
jgi:serine/threonine-protein kinase